MSDFGAEFGNTGISAGTKLVEAVLRLIGKVFSAIYERTGADYKLKKAQLKEHRTLETEKAFQKEVEGMTGYVNYNTLKKAGVPLTSCEVKMTEQQLKEFASYCKRENILITGTENALSRELEGTKIFTLMCKKEDLQRIAELVDLMNAEKRIEKIQAEIKTTEKESKELSKELRGLRKKNNPSVDEIARIEEIENKLQENTIKIAEYQNEVNAVRYSFSRQWNADLSDEALESVFNGRQIEAHTFDEALNRITGRKIDNDIDYFVVDAKNPNNYIKCHSENAEFRGEIYTKTDYEVFKDGKSVLTTDDGRFEGRPKNYWQTQKDNMKTAGGFSDMTYKFYTEAEVEAYRTYYREQNENEISPFDVGKDGRNYDELVNELERKLDSCGAVYKDGEVLDKTTDKPLVLSDDMDEVQRANATEALVIGKQIDNYRNIANLEENVALAKTDVLTTAQDSKERATAEAKLLEAETALEQAKVTEKALVEERMIVNAVQSEQETRSPSNEIERLEGEIQQDQARFDKLYSEWENDGNADSIIEAKMLQSSLSWKIEELKALKEKEGIETTDSEKTADGKTTKKVYDKKISEKKQNEPKTAVKTVEPSKTMSHSELQH